MPATLPIPRIYTEPIGDPGKAYRPSNGTEGHIFEQEFCRKCRLDHEAHKGYPENGCLIFARALAYGVHEPEYPTELRILGDGYPGCTGFEPDGCS